MNPTSKITLHTGNENLKVCPHCQFHFRIKARQRVYSLVEAGSFEELDGHMTSVNAMNFIAPVTYESKLAGCQEVTGQKERFSGKRLSICRQ